MLYGQRYLIVKVLTSLRPSPSPKPKAPKSPKKGTRNFASGRVTKILWATHHPPHHPQLLSMMKASNKKTQRVKVTQNNPLYWLSTKNSSWKAKEKINYFHHIPVINRIIFRFVVSSQTLMYNPSSDFTPLLNCTIPIGRINTNINNNHPPTHPQRGLQHACTFSP